MIFYLYRKGYLYVIQSFHKNGKITLEKIFLSENKIKFTGNRITISKRLLKKQFKDYLNQNKNLKRGKSMARHKLKN